MLKFTDPDFGTSTYLDPKEIVGFERIHENYKRFTAAYLRNREGYVKIDELPDEAFRMINEYNSTNVIKEFNKNNKMSNKIYVVLGTTGEYSDKSEWSVKAFSSADKAHSLADKANASAKAMYRKYTGEKHWYSRPQGEVIPEDPNFMMDYTGTSYYVIEMEMEE